MTEAIDQLEGLIDPGDLAPLKMAIEKTITPTKTYRELGEKHMPPSEGSSVAWQSVKVRKQITRIKSKYPEIFKPFKDESIVNMEDMATVLVGIAKNPLEKASSRVSAAKAIISTALEIEKMVKDKEVSTTSLSTMAFEDQTYDDIINDGIRTIDAHQIPTK